MTKKMSVGATSRAILAAGRAADVHVETTKERTAGIPADVQPEVTILALQRAGIVSSPPAPAKPTGSSPALAIQCPVCSSPVGAYCVKADGARQIIAHKKRSQVARAERRARGGL